MELVSCSCRKNVLHVMLGLRQFLLRCWSFVARTVPSNSLSLSLSLSPPPPPPTKNHRSLTQTSAPHSDGSHLPGFRFTSLTQRSAYRKVIYRDCACSSVCLWHSRLLRMGGNGLWRKSEQWAGWQCGEGGTRHLRTEYNIQTFN